ncbi:MAG: hypothetical protein IJ385_02165 [Ruminiclostridium sp.]|nr:hypothetical protein [Ruminiclostridium sp.]
MTKRLSSALTAIMVLIALAGCTASEPVQTTTASPAEQTTTSEAEETTTEAEQTTTLAETAPEETTSSGKTVLKSFPDGETVFYKEDGDSEVSQDTLVYDTAFVYPSTGAYYDEILNPEMFESDNFNFKGEQPEIDNVVAVKAGDKIGGAEIASAEYCIYIGTESPMVVSNGITIKDELTLTGIMYFYEGDDYMVAAGDVMFLPDSSYEGLPLASLSVDYGGGEFHSGTLDFAGIAGGFSAYSDAPKLRLGNLFTDLADNAELNSVLDGGKAFCTKKVQVTLRNVNLEWSENFGDGRCSAELVDVNELE